MIHKLPKDRRRNLRAFGSMPAADGRGNVGAGAAAARRARMIQYASVSTRKTAATAANCCSSIDRNAATRAGSVVVSPGLMPGTGLPPCRLGWRGGLASWW